MLSDNVTLHKEKDFTWLYIDEPGQRLKVRTAIDEHFDPARSTDALFYVSVSDPDAPMLTDTFRRNECGDVVAIHPHVFLRLFVINSEYEDKTPDEMIAIIMKTAEQKAEGDGMTDVDKWSIKTVMDAVIEDRMIELRPKPSLNPRVN
jgi:hypothetical protein